jgi:GrpB-like predicted nucleotidyltransferase (UPF0157 family)
VWQHPSVTETSGGTEFVRPRAQHNATIHLAEHDPQWAEQYAGVARKIRQALDERALLLEHVGSTSVPGLAAKPILDVLLLVADPTDETSYVPDLETAGFLLHLREPGWHEHRLLRGTDPAVNLHVLGVGSPEAERMLLFRDRLRSEPAELDTYLRAKRGLAAQEWPVVQDYADAKSAVVEGILARALAEGGQD